MQRLTMLAAGGTMFQATGGCDEDARLLVAQGVSSLVLSIINQLIQTGVNDLFGLPTSGGGF
jgi:hypothetical protein